MTSTWADRQSFDPLPAVYDRFAELVGRPLREYLAARLPAHGGRAVDLGCGTGQHATLLADHYSEVLAVDLSEAMLHHAQTHRPQPNITYQRADLREVTPDRAGRFDLALSPTPSTTSTGSTTPRAASAGSCPTTGTRS